MKTILLLVALFLGVHSAEAAEYDFPYLTFETTEGKKVSIEVTTMSFAIDGSTLTVGSQSFTLANLAKMYFSATDETATNINELDNVDSEAVVAVYDLNGKVVDKSHISKGVYIAKMKDESFKMVVK